MMSAAWEWAKAHPFMAGFAAYYFACAVAVVYFMGDVSDDHEEPL